MDYTILKGSDSFVNYKEDRNKEAVYFEATIQTAEKGFSPEATVVINSPINKNSEAEITIVLKPDGSDNDTVIISNYYIGQSNLNVNTSSHCDITVVNDATNSRKKKMHKPKNKKRVRMPL